MDEAASRESLLAAMKGAHQAYPNYWIVYAAWDKDCSYWWTSEHASPADGFVYAKDKVRFAAMWIEKDAEPRRQHAILPFKADDYPWTRTAEACAYYSKHNEKCRGSWRSGIGSRVYDEEWMKELGVGIIAATDDCEGFKAVSEPGNPYFFNVRAESNWGYPTNVLALSQGRYTDR